MVTTVNIECNHTCAHAVHLWIHDMLQARFSLYVFRVAGYLQISTHFGQYTAYVLFSANLICVISRQIK